MTAITSLTFAISLVIASWLVVGTSLRGLGTMTSRLWRDRDDDARGHAPFWIGFAVVIAFLQVWNGFAPISAVPAVLALLVGLPLGVTWLWRDRHLARPIVFALIALWLADRALAPANASDSGLYHLPAIRLAGDFAIIPGIGNLMPAFAINSGSFLFTAMLNVGPLAGRGWHVANSMLLMAFILRLWPAACRVLRGDGRAADGFEAAIIPLCLFLLMGKDISSPKTDLPAGLLLLVMASQLARLLCDNIDVRSLCAHVITATVLGGTAVCVKISAAPMAGLLWIGFVALWFVRERPAVPAVARVFAAIMLIAALLPGVLVVRNIITSGYPLFPAAVMPVDVDWRLEPAAIAKYHRGFAEFTRFDLAQGLAKKVESSPLRLYGRLMDPGFSTLDEATATNWIRGWFFTMLVAWPIEVALPLVIAAVLWIFGPRGDASGRRARNIIATTAAITLVLWFVTVPDGRYIWFATWAVAGAAAIPALTFGERASTRGSSTSTWRTDGAESSTRVLKHARQGRIFIASGFALAFLSVIVFRVGLQLVYRDGPIADVFIVRPGPDHGFHPAPVSNLTTWTSRHGLTLSYPANGSGTVWFSPQPATTVKYLDPDLRFRGKDFQSGVMIDRRP